MCWRWRRDAGLAGIEPISMTNTLGSGTSAPRCRATEAMILLTTSQKQIATARHLRNATIRVYDLTVHPRRTAAAQERNDIGDVVRLAEPSMGRAFYKTSELRFSFAVGEQCRVTTPGAIA